MKKKEPDCVFHEGYILSNTMFPGQEKIILGFLYKYHELCGQTAIEMTILLMHVRTMAGLTWSKYLIMDVHLFWYCQKKILKILSVNKTNYTKMQKKSITS